MKSKASKETKPAESGFGVKDIILVVFRHKWKICLFGILGMAAAATVHLTRTPVYASTAKLLVRYIVERSSVDPVSSNTSAGGRGGGHVIDAEVEILSSWDLALEVADEVGIEDLVPDGDENVTVIDAANTIADGLEVGVKRDSNVIAVTYHGTDPDLTMEVLRELVRRYFDKHIKIHRSVGGFDEMLKEAEVAGDQLRDTVAELEKLKSESGILSFEVSAESLDSQRGSASEKLLDAETSLVGQDARVAAIKAILEGDQGSSQDQNEVPLKRVDPLVVAEHEDLAERIADLREAREERLNKFKPSDRVAIDLASRIRSLVQQRADLLKSNPGLVMQTGPAGAAGPALPDMINEEALLARLKAEVTQLKSGLNDLDRRFATLSEASSKLEELERRKELEEKDYLYIESRLKQLRSDAAIDSSNLQNIRMLQNPSAPKEVYNDKTKKIVLGLAGSGFAFGLALAFLIDLVLDRRVKAPLEIQTRLQVPLLMSIPNASRKLRGSRMLIEDRQVERIGAGEDGFTVPAMEEGGSGLASVRGLSDQFIMPYAEAIRNRIIFNFEMNKINHKPKLIALTGLSEGAGTSTVAAGLAKAFSQADDVKVLLVDLNRRSPEEAPLIENGSHHSLDGALKVARHTQFKNGGPSLHFARIPEQTNGHKSFTPLHLHGMLPDFRASDFDYIIFDMPQVDPTSPTLAMAGLMDKVLLVLDGENTDREELQWGYSELTRGQADVSCVFNKSREVGPRWLLGEA